MTDVPRPRRRRPTPTDPLSDARALRLRRRYAAERRFRLYGLAAVAFAVGLLGAAARRASSATGYSGFCQTEIALDVHVRSRRSSTRTAARDPAVLRAGRLRRGRARGAARARSRRSTEPPGPARARTGCSAAGARTRAARHACSRTRRSLGRTVRVWLRRGRRGRHAASRARDSRAVAEARAAASPTSRSAGSTRSSRTAHRARLQRELLHRRRHPRAGAGRHLGALLGLVLDHAGDARARLPARRRGGGLPRGVRAAESLDRPHRGQHQQPGGGAVDRLRPARARGVPQLLRPAALGAAGRRPRAGADDLPTIIIAARAAIKAVPPSIREAALGVGASPMQVVLHHVLPLAMPGILTGTIIGMARALGETAPLLMIGMVAFIVDVPSGFADAATVLPVQIFLWADSPERGFVEKTAAAIIVLLVFLVADERDRGLSAPALRAAVVTRRWMRALLVEGRSSHRRRAAATAARASRGRRAVNDARARRQRLLRREAGAQRRRPRHPRERR